MRLKRISSQDIRLYLIVNIRVTKSKAIPEIEDIIRSGIDMVQLRCKGLDDRIFFDYALKLRRACKDCNIPFIINDRADIALGLSADGLHIGQDDIPPHIARRIIGADKILGLSCHNISQIKQASAIKDIDYIGIGPVFKTETKQKCKSVGLGLVRDALRYGIKKPSFAIGGINSGNISKVIDCGIKAVCVSSAVFGSKDPILEVAKLRNRLYDTD